jgi:hypothetical protein
MKPIVPQTPKQIREAQRAMQDFTAAATLVACVKPSGRDDPAARAILEELVAAGERGELEGVRLYGFTQYSVLGRQAAHALGMTWNKRKQKGEQ